ncbi:MAG: LysM peptidoglycan-binding domain-containing protein [Clostridia bacterium]|nr:LysM peptidoglycan-binding domain-containing protein [Clostridia bacterium]
MQYIHKVRKNESVNEICSYYSIMRDDLLTINNITEDNIKEGLLLFIDIPEGIRYVVKPFDNISKIAEKFGVTVDNLREFNNLSEVFLGQIIYIPNIFDTI